MNRILILLASLLVVGCPQGAYQPATGENVKGYAKSTAPEGNDLWCADDNSVWWTASSNIYTMSGQPPCGSWAKAFATKSAAQAYLDGASPKLIWCAGAHAVSRSTASSCTANGGLAFENEWEARKAHENWGKNTTPTPTPTPEPDYQLVGKGTGFVVSKHYVVTANHVLRATEDVYGPVCNATSILYKHKEYDTEVVELDIANDLGLLMMNEPLSEAAKLRNEPDLMVGEVAVNYGYPLSNALSSSAKLNAGTVSSLAGYENNSAILQYDAATQRGNSGGPVMDASGNVIGVVRSGLDNAETQLVNFATKSTILEGFLKANKVPFEKADLGEKLELPDIAEKAETFTVLVVCWE